MPFFQPDATLQTLSDRSLDAVWSAFPELTRTQLALTWIVYDDPVPVNTGGALRPEEFWAHPVRGVSYRGMESFDPAHLAGLFYLVAAQEWLHQGMVAPAGELDRALSDMVVKSSTDAMSLIVDVLSGTTSGPELPSAPFVTWQQQRNIVNRYFQSLNWTELESINVNQKVWQDGPYGRERLFMGTMLENRNRLTTDAIARLLHSIIGGVAVSAERSRQMMTLLRRPMTPTAMGYRPDDLVIPILRDGLPTTAQVWGAIAFSQSRQGLPGIARMPDSGVIHLAAYVESPEVPPYLLVMMTDTSLKATELRATELKTTELLAFLAAQLVQELTAEAKE